jgi:hypothetical protein
MARLGRLIAPLMTITISRTPLADQQGGMGMEVHHKRAEMMDVAASKAAAGSGSRQVHAGERRAIRQ